MEKTWIVTGASKGIGLSSSNKLLKLGYKVIGISRTTPPIDHPFFEHLPLDLSDLDAIHLSLESLKKRAQEIEGVLFSAGIGYFHNLEELSEKKIFEMLNVNLLSEVVLTKELLPFLKKHNKAYLIYIGSEAALAGKKRSTAYSMTKFGQRGFVQALRQECGPTGVKVTLIQPGMTKTSFYDSLYFEPKEDGKSAIDPGDLADLLPLILSAKEGTCFDEIMINPKTVALQFKN